MPKGWVRRDRDEESTPGITVGHFDPPEEPREVTSPSLAPQTERERQLHGLTVLSLFLHSTASVEEMMGMVLEQAPTVTGAVFVYPLLLDRKRQVLRASSLQGASDTRMDAAMEAFQEDLLALEFPLNKSDELRKMLEGGEVAVQQTLEPLMTTVLPEEQWKPAQNELRVRRVAFVPMVVENEPLGMVVFAFDQDDIDIEALELLVGHLTLALRDLLLRDEAVRFTDVDPVTWVYNRRYLQHALQNEIIRAGRYGRALSLAMLDIEGFGHFNEEYGQSMGDRLLRIVATTIAETLSPPELVARMQDDDFAVLLPETNRAAAVTTVTRLLASLAHLSAFEGDDAGQPVTFAVSITCFPEDATTAQELLGRASLDLEAAKEDRRADERRQAARGRGAA